MDLGFRVGSDASACAYNPEMLARSYPMPRHFPLGDPFHLVMESAPGSCDLYDGASARMKNGTVRSICELFSNGVLMQPEVHSRQVISSFLGDCHLRKSCSAVDIGANNGWVSGMMLALGVKSLTSVEPQADLADALQQTARLNCWDSAHGRSVRVLSNAIGLDASLAGKPITLRCGYRLYHFSKRYRGRNCTTTLVPIHEVVREPRYDLIKIDVDGIDGLLLQWLQQRIKSGQLSVETIFIECSGCDPIVLWSFQQELGYHAYLLDNTDERRVLSKEGRDIANNFKPIADLDPMLSERYALRFLRHVFYVSRKADKAAWRRIDAPRPKPVGFIYRGRNPAGPREYVFTKQILPEPELHELVNDKSIRHGSALPQRKAT